MNNEPYLTCNIDQVRGQYSNQPHLTSNLDIVLFHQVTCIYTGDFVCVYVCINKYIFCTIVAKNFYGDYVIDMRTSLPCLDFLTYLWLFDLNMRKTWVYVYQNLHDISFQLPRNSIAFCWAKSIEVVFYRTWCQNDTHPPCSLLLFISCLPSLLLFNPLQIYKGYTKLPSVLGSLVNN